MANFKSKPCKICGDEFTPHSPCAFYCDVCRPKALHEIQKRADQRYRLRKGVRPVGSGGTTQCGPGNPAWIDGRGIFHRMRKVVKAEVSACERCGVDLSNAGRYHWCVHHKDHNRANNDRDNLILLCKRCHQVEHRCFDNFRKGVETISEESRE